MRESLLSADLFQAAVKTLSNEFDTTIGTDSSRKGVFGYRLLLINLILMQKLLIKRDKLIYLHL